MAPIDNKAKWMRVGKYFLEHFGEKPQQIWTKKVNFSFCFLFCFFSCRFVSFLVFTFVLFWWWWWWGGKFSINSLIISLIFVNIYTIFKWPLLSYHADKAVFGFCFVLFLFFWIVSCSVCDMCFRASPRVYTYPVSCFVAEPCLTCVSCRLHNSNLT